MGEGGWAIGLSSAGYDGYMTPNMRLLEARWFPVMTWTYSIIDIFSTVQCIYYSVKVYYAYV